MSDHTLMDRLASVYLRKRSPSAAYWTHLEQCPERVVPMALRSLIKRHRTLVGAETARYVLAWLHDEGFCDDDEGGTGMPVEVVDHRGRPAGADFYPMGLHAPAGVRAA